MKRKLTTLFFALFVCALPLFAIVDGKPLTNTLHELKDELQTSYVRLPQAQKRFDADYEQRHQEMLDVITKSNELSILLYTQENWMTFDMAYALQKVTSAYKDFNKNRRPFDRSISMLDYEINRYARLIEALRRLPPEMKEIEVEIVPDSLLYHNDSLDQHMSDEVSSFEKEIIRVAIKDSANAPMTLDVEGEMYRDSCIFYASELLKMYADNRETIMKDSTHYQVAYMRMKENYDYAEERYQELQNYVFQDGQLPYMSILSHRSGFWRIVKRDLHNQYDINELDSAKADKSESSLENMSSKGTHVYLILGCVMQLVVLFLFWVAIFGILWAIERYAKPKRFFHKKQLPLVSILVGTILYMFIFSFIWHDNEYLQIGIHNINTFLVLLIAISTSLLLRVKPEQIRHGFMLYTPVFVIALVIIICRNSFIPDSLMMLLFPPVLLLMIIRQLVGCISKSGKATKIDSRLGWASLAIYIVAFVISFIGYTFAALLILVWWYVQLAILLAVVCISDLLKRYKERWLDKRIKNMRKRITFVSGNERESLLFGATWFHDLIRQVGIPTVIALSLPMSVHMSLNIFDFNDLFAKFYHEPFVHLTDSAGIETVCISVKSIVFLFILFYMLRYLNRAMHAIWQYTRYTMFMRKNNRTTVRANEINLSLGNSIISGVIWMIYAIVVITVWKIPTGSLGLVAGGLSAGIGLALKDIINNFIYGIQLMGGRLRVGDWIECDGIRGRVSAINYQCVQVETVEGTEMSFLNASLFGKNFNNLTRNNSYEFTKIVVGVAYGTDVDQVRNILVDAMQKLRTKDHYGRDIVEPKRGIYVAVDNMSDSAVDIAIKQYVLVAERAGYIDRSKETIYNALNAAGINIPFPQCDVHLIHDDK